MKRRLLPALVLATLAGAAAFATTTEATTAIHEPLSVMSFNVRLATSSDGPNAWSERANIALDVIREAAPDILGVQEALQDQLDTIVAATPNGASIGIARDNLGADEYSAIVFDTSRFTVLDSGTFWLSDTPGEPSTSWGNDILRICTWGRFARNGSGSVFYVYNTHLDHRSAESRLRSVELILERIRTRAHADPFVLMGDFNANESSPPIQLLTKGGTSLADPFRTLHPDTVEVGTFHGFSGEARGGKIDHIFVPTGTKVLSAEIIRTHRDGRYPSDHFPVSAVIRFAGSRRPEG